ncbi:uncharacterized protein EV420DRAFT_1486845 [Desarmillaria tabescens]|uniref:Uncharacterized protein n=1 Tax=Armillaria tabescens TaxID=1929756 RepID=A0AA39MKT1_ARMTA|nr:uncharacterized protein EV420DRAFT_1486845 [Desarmillaria tabescens]KAK0437972.1 hypothetical protein EV420DRAFT_1486845 [Desarmillaria tabescens]
MIMMAAVHVPRAYNPPDVQGSAPSSLNTGICPPCTTCYPSQYNYGEGAQKLCGQSNRLKMATDIPNTTLLRDQGPCINGITPSACWKTNLKVGILRAFPELQAHTKCLNTSVHDFYPTFEHVVGGSPLARVWSRDRRHPGFGLLEAQTTLALIHFDTSEDVFTGGQGFQDSRHGVGLKDVQECPDTPPTSGAQQSPEPTHSSNARAGMQATFVGLKDDPTDSLARDPWSHEHPQRTRWLGKWWYVDVVSYADTGSLGSISHPGTDHEVTGTNDDHQCSDADQRFLNLGTKNHHHTTLMVEQTWADPFLQRLYKSGSGVIVDIRTCRLPALVLLREDETARYQDLGLLFRDLKVQVYDLVLNYICTAFITESRDDCSTRGDHWCYASSSRCGEVQGGRDEVQEEGFAPRQSVCGCGRKDSLRERFVAMRRAGGRHQWRERRLVLSRREGFCGEGVAGVGTAPEEKHVVTENAEAFMTAMM